MESIVRLDAISSMPPNLTESETYSFLVVLVQGVSDNFVEERA